MAKLISGYYYKLNENEIARSPSTLINHLFKIHKSKPFKCIKVIENNISLFVKFEGQQLHNYGSDTWEILKSTTDFFEEALLIKQEEMEL